MAIRYFRREQNGELYMLQDNNSLQSLDQVAELSIDLLTSLNGITTMVFGPVWSECADTVTDNLELLDFYCKAYAKDGHQVLHTPSLLAVSTRIAEKKYAERSRQEIVPNVTGPIIQKAKLKKAVFLNCGPESVNTLIEKGLADEVEETEVIEIPL